MKKLISLLLVVFMLFALATVAFAEGEGATENPDPSISGTYEGTPGSIVINGVTLDESNRPIATLALYQILELKSYNTTSASYDYAFNDKWADFFKENAPGAEYVGLNADGVLVWRGAMGDRTAEFAKIALAYAQKEGIKPDVTSDPRTVNGETVYDYTVEPSTGTITFADLKLGYYLVDSTVGALCSLSTTNPNGIINAKNNAPTLEKQVQEDLGGHWGKKNTADIGQDVNFRITIKVHDGAQNYVLHDLMEDGFTFKPDTVKVTLIDGASGSSDETGVLVNEKETDTEGVEHTNYIVDDVPDEDHTFKVEFTEYFCKKLNTNDRLIVSYTAMLNKDAEIGKSTAENPANQNSAHLVYGTMPTSGKPHVSNEDSTTTETYGFDLIKTDGQNKLLDGAKFKIYDAEEDGNEIAVVLLKKSDPTKPDDLGYDVYRKARTGENREDGVEISVDGGRVRVVGLDNGVYYLEETKNPAGYTPLSGRQKFTIADANLDATFNDGVYSTGSGVHVVNYTGSMLPETGGLGTLLFTVLGGSTVLGSGVVLVTKKRMSKIVDED